MRGFGTVVSSRHGRVLPALLLALLGATQGGCSNTRDILFDSDNTWAHTNAPYAIAALVGIAGTGRPAVWPSPPQPAGSPARSRQALAVRAASTTESIATYVPAMTFQGQRTVLVGAAASSGSRRTGAGFVREADCSWTQHVLDSSKAATGPIVASMPRVQAYLRALAEQPPLTTAFASGCVDDLTGRAAQPVAYLGRTPAGMVVAAAIDISGSLHAGTATSAAVTRTTTRLATRTAQHFAHADLNGDGIDDIVLPWQEAASGRPAGLAVYLSRSDGTFEAPTVHPVAGSRFHAWASVADVNGDGAPDIVMLGGTDLFTTTLTVLLGDGRGGFTAGPVRSGAGDMGAIVVADLDRDGRKDVLSAAGSLLRGRGDGSFAAPVRAWETVSSFDHLAIADFDRDGRLDVALTTAPSGGFVTVMRGRGDGTFQEGESYAAVQGATTLGATDVDGDGHVDIVVGLVGAGVTTSGTTAHTMTQFLFGRGDATFVGAQAWPSPSLAGVFASDRSAVALADLDGDGIADLLAPTPRMLTSAAPSGPGTLAWRRGGSQGLGVPAQIPVTHPGAVAVAVGDVDGDGRADIVYATRDLLAVRRSTGAGVFGTETSRSLPGEPRVLRVADFDGDRRADVAVLAADGVRVYRGQADGSLAAPVTVEASAELTALDAADLDGDGRADLLIGRADGRIVLRTGAPGGAFGAAIALPAGRSVEALAIADIDADGRRDLVAAATDAGGNAVLQVFRSQGGTTYAAPTTKALVQGSGSIVSSLAVADFNGDGKVDVALVRDRISAIVMGLGDGRLGEEFAFVLAGNAAALQAGDLDGDGQPDLTVTVNLTGVVTLVNKTRQWGAAGGGTASDVDRVMNWAEVVYRAYFPGPGTAGTYEGYQYRYYPATGNYLAAKDGRVIVHNGRDWNFLDVGALSTFLPLATAAGY